MFVSSFIHMYVSIHLYVYISLFFSLSLCLSLSLWHAEMTIFCLYDSISYSSLWLYFILIVNYRQLNANSFCTAYQLVSDPPTLVSGGWALQNVLWSPDLGSWRLASQKKTRLKLCKTHVSACLDWMRVCADICLTHVTCTHSYTRTVAVWGWITTAGHDCATTQAGHSALSVMICVQVCTCSKSHW